MNGLTYPAKGMGVLVHLERPSETEVCNFKDETITGEEDCEKDQISLLLLVAGTGKLDVERRRLTVFGLQVAMNDDAVVRAGSGSDLWLMAVLDGRDDLGEHDPNVFLAEVRSFCGHFANEAEEIACFANLLVDWVSRWDAVHARRPTSMRIHKMPSISRCLMIWTVF